MVTLRLMVMMTETRRTSREGVPEKRKPKISHVNLKNKFSSHRFIVLQKFFYLLLSTSLSNPHKMECLLGSRTDEQLLLYVCVKCLRSLLLKVFLYFVRISIGLSTKTTGSINIFLILCSNFPLVKECKKQKQL